MTKSNRKEAKTLITQFVDEYARKPYQELHQMLGKEPITFDTVGPSGMEYQVEIEVIRDYKHKRTIRILGGIDRSYRKAWFFVPYVLDAGCTVTVEPDE